jgi:hypothetical protein
MPVAKKPRRRAGSRRRTSAPASGGSDTRARGRHGREDLEELVAEITSKLRAAMEEVAELSARASALATDRFSEAGEIFATELRSLLGQSSLDPDAARRAAHLAAADRLWEDRLGELWDTQEVMRTLGVSRQRVSKLAQQHRLIALPDEGRLRFPAWQFAVVGADDRASLATAHHDLVDIGRVDPWSAASWFLSGHPELDGSDPVAWLRKGGSSEQLLLAARRDAARAAQ